MSPIPNPRVVFNDIPEGFPEPGKTTVYDDSNSIDLDTLPVPAGAFVVKTLYLAIDPYMRGQMRKPEIESYSLPFIIGQPLFGYGVGVVVKSQNSELKKGAHVYGYLNHQIYSLHKEKGDLIALDNKVNIPLSYYLGICGMPGKTAYHAWHEFSNAKKGETVFVTAGAGSVGSLVIQLAKLDGCRVIASAGTDEKIDFLKSIGADVAFNYRSTNTLEVLQREGGIDIYWDNVGGETLDAALEAAHLYARFIECGMQSGYNTGGAPVKKLGNIIGKSISMNGFIVYRLAHKYEERFYEEVPKLVAEGKLKYREQIFDGLQSVGEVILAVQKGENVSKAVIKVSDE